MARKKRDGFVKIPNQIIERYGYGDRLLAWIWLSQTRDYTTDYITKSLRQISGKFGWSHAKAQRFTDTLTDTATDTPKRRPRKDLNDATDTPSDKLTDTTRAVPIVVQEVNTKNPPTPQNGGNDLPDWLDQKLWADYIEHRKQLKKPLTAIAYQRAISLLERLKGQGHDPSKLITVALERNWLTFFITDETFLADHLTKARKPFAWVDEIGESRDDQKVGEDADHDIQDDRRSASRD